MSTQTDEQGGIDTQEPEANFDPAENPSQNDYQDKFNPSGNAGGDSFNYTGDSDRDALAQRESSSQGGGSASSKKERDSVSSKAGEGGWNTRVKSGAKGAKNFLSSGKKKVAAGVIAGGGIGAVVMFMFFIIPFLNLMSLEQLTTTMRTYRFANIHYANFKRTAQYTVQESLEPPSTRRGKVAAKLASFSPEKTMRNLTQDGVVEFVTKMVKPVGRGGQPAPSPTLLLETSGLKCRNRV